MVHQQWVQMMGLRRRGVGVVLVAACGPSVVDVDGGGAADESDGTSSATSDATSADDDSSGSDVPEPPPQPQRLLAERATPDGDHEIGWIDAELDGVSEFASLSGDLEYSVGRYAALPGSDVVGFTIVGELYEHAYVVNDGDVRSVVGPPFEWERFGWAEPLRTLVYDTDDGALVVAPLIDGLLADGRIVDVPANAYDISFDSSRPIGPYDQLSANVVVSSPFGDEEVLQCFIADLTDPAPAWRLLDERCRLEAYVDDSLVYSVRVEDGVAQSLWSRRVSDGAFLEPEMLTDVVDRLVVVGDIAIVLDDSSGIASYISLRLGASKQLQELHDGVQFLKQSEDAGFVMLGNVAFVDTTAEDPVAITLDHPLGSQDVLDQTARGTESHEYLVVSDREQNTITRIDALGTTAVMADIAPSSWDVARDGSALAYAVETDEGYELYYRELHDLGAPTVFLGATTRGPVEFSPDARVLASGALDLWSLRDDWHVTLALESWRWWPRA